MLLLVAGIGAWSLGGWVSGLLCVCGGGGVSLRCHFEWGGWCVPPETNFCCEEGVL